MAQLKGKTQLAIVIAMRRGLAMGHRIENVFARLKEGNVVSSADAWQQAADTYAETKSLANALSVTKLFDREVSIALTFADLDSGNPFDPALTYLTAVVAGE